MVVDRYRCVDHSNEKGERTHDNLAVPSQWRSLHPAINAIAACAIALHRKLRP
jgi:hypothetical protein